MVTDAYSHQRISSRQSPVGLALFAFIVATGAGSTLAAEVRPAAGTPSALENWPAWRGDGTGVATGKSLPVSWSETENVHWRVPLPGEGNSSPVVWGHRVFLTAALNEGLTRLVLCLDADSGKTLWQTELVPEIKTTLYPKTGFAAPTPTVDGRCVYVYFDEPGLVALDMDGRVVWKRRLGPFDAPYNQGSSPVLYKDLVIQCCDHHGPSFVAAFERRSGQERWHTARPSSGFGHFGTPLVIDVGGQSQVVINGEPVTAYSPDTGAEIWSCRGMKECVAPSPVFGHGLVYASSGRTGPVMAIDPTGHGDVTETRVRLHLTSGGPYVPTPLVYPHLLVPGDNGRLLLYSGTHQRIGDERVRDHFTASPIAGDGKVYWASERGRVYVIDAARLMGDKPSAVVLAANQLRGACLATPAIAHGRLYIRTTAALYCVGGKETAGVAQSAPSLPTTFAGLKQRYEQHQAHWQNEPEAQIRLETLEAIANLDDPGVVPFLLWAVQKEPHWDICEEAVKSLGRKGALAIPSLLVLVPDSRPFVRTVAINELGRLRATEAVPAMLKALDDKQPLVRCASLQALGPIGRDKPPQLPQITGALLSMLADRAGEEAVVRQAALDGLAALGSQPPPHRSEIIRSLVAVVSDRNPRLAKKAEEILQKVYQVTPAELDQARGARQ
jgi:outer membrane protein assembly factor BamB